MPRDTARTPSSAIECWVQCSLFTSPPLPFRLIIDQPPEVERVVVVVMATSMAAPAAVLGTATLASIPPPTATPLPSRQPLIMAGMRRAVLALELDRGSP